MSDQHSTSVSVRSLPQQPSLEQLRKQAKELLERFRAAEPAAVAEIRQFEHNPDASNFALNDAQRVLARAYGFASWPKLKAFVDGATVARFTDAVKAGDMAEVRSMLASRPELVGMDRAGNDEHRGLHYAVLSRNAPMVKLLMEAGADARQGIYPNRDATSALTLAQDREYSDIVAIIEEDERQRREEMTCPKCNCLAGAGPDQRGHLAWRYGYGDTPAWSRPLTYTGLRPQWRDAAAYRRAGSQS